MEVGNEMEIFITLTKYNTHQQREEVNPLLIVYYLISIFTLLTIVSNVSMRRNGTYPLMFIGTVYKTFNCLNWHSISRSLILKLTTKKYTVL